MDPLVASLVVILVALVGARLSFSTERIASGPRLVFRTGIHFLFVGMALGPVGLGLLSEEATHQLYPFLALGLGWIGFHFGLQLDRGSLSHFPWPYHVMALGQAFLTLVLFAAMAWAGMRLLGLQEDVLAILVLGAAATAALTTPAGIAMVSSNFLVRGNVRDLLFFIASVDAVVGITALEVVYALYRPAGVTTNLGPLPQLSLVAVAVGLGVLCGIVFLWLVRSRPGREELVLYLLGICALASGAALQWGLSPLFVSMVMGILVANLGRDRQRVFVLLQRWEKPVYLTFLLIAGALLQLPTLLVVGLAVAYAIVRALAKTVSAGVLAVLVPLPFAVPKRLGLGLIPQGGVSLAMAVSGVLVYSELQVNGGDAEPALFAVVVLGVVLAELVGPLFTAQVLRRAGEITPEVEAALASGDPKRAEKAALKLRTPRDGSA